MKKNIPETTLESIVVNKLFFGAKTEDICKKYNLSRAFVNATVAAYKAVEVGDWEKVVFMLNGAQTTIKVVEWAARRLGVTVPESLYAPKEEPKPEPVTEQLEGQTKLDEFGKKIDGDTTVKFGTSANNTLHALIDALNKNAEESAQLRKAVFALLHSSGCVE